jgi:hypothetical protein
MVYNNIMENIKIIRNAMLAQNAEKISSYIDNLVQSKGDLFSTSQEDKSMSIVFGKNDLYEKNNDVSILSEDNQSFIFESLKLAIEKTQESFSDQDNMHVSSFALSKELPGSIGVRRADANQDINSHFGYTAIFFLNSLPLGGEISFMEPGYSYKPLIGDLVIFPSQSIGDHLVFEIPSTRYTMPIWITKFKSMAIL